MGCDPCGLVSNFWRKAAAIPSRMFVLSYSTAWRQIPDGDDFSPRTC